MTPKERAMSEPADPVLGGETRDRLDLDIDVATAILRQHLAMRTGILVEPELMTLSRALSGLLGEVSRLRERVKELEGEEVTGVTGRPNPAVEGSPDP